MVGLMMIVKDEAHVIERCLASVRDRIDWWVIADTGSTDDTPTRVRAALDGIPGRLLRHDWVDFAHNRNLVLDAARQHRLASDPYVLTIDADEQLLPGDWPPHLALDAVDGAYLPVTYDGLTYPRLAVVDVSRPWRWQGVVHEVLCLDGATTTTLDWPTVLVTHDGARSRDPETYARDVAVLRAEVDRDPIDARSWFYLAQSYRDAGQYAAALDAYDRRVQLGGWDQEVYVARLNLAALLCNHLGLPADAADQFVQAHELCPWRAEAPVGLAAHHRTADRFATAQLYAAAAVTATPRPGDLFTQVDASGWRAHDELAVASYQLGDYPLALTHARAAVMLLPDDERLAANVEWCEAALAH